MTLVWTVISGILIFAILMLVKTLVGYERRLKQGFPPMALKESEIKAMKVQPQSGFWINCRNHGDMPLTKEAYEFQCKVEKYTCPLCGQIPRKIWRKDVPVEVG